MSTSFLGVPGIGDSDCGCVSSVTRMAGMADTDALLACLFCFEKEMLPTGAAAAASTLSAGCSTDDCCIGLNVYFVGDGIFFLIKVGKERLLSGVPARLAMTAVRVSSEPVFDED